MFFYRAWIINEGENLQNTPSVFGRFESSFSYYSWGYGVLLGLTLTACLLLNLFFLASFCVNGLGGRPRKAPNVALLCLSLRDLMVCLVLIPICIDWYVVNSGFFKGGFILCKFAAFLEHFLAAEYPLLVIAFAIVLLTRKFPKVRVSSAVIRVSSIVANMN